jgi:hypothetical protein
MACTCRCGFRATIANKIGNAAVVGEANQMNDDRIREGIPPLEPFDLRDSRGDRSPSLIEKDVLVDEPRAAEVFVAWERLRLVFNLILVVVVIILVNPLGAMLLLPILAPNAGLANLCFCAGPVAEGYLCLLNMRRRAARVAVFTTGTLLAVALTWYFLKVELPVLMPDR